MIKDLIVYISLSIVIVYWVLITFKIKYKGKCILHDYNWNVEFGKYNNLTKQQTRKNEHFLCRKCNKRVDIQN